MSSATIHCPACNAPCDGAALRSFGAEEAAQHFVLREEFPQAHAELVPHIRALWGSEHCTLQGCAACGLQFAWPFVAGDGRFYNLAYPYSDYPQQRWEFLQTVQALDAQPLHEGRLLEIGSGFGHFLRQVSPRFMPPGRVLAIEYNDTARARLEAMGFTAHGIDVREPAFAAYRGQVAALCLFQVLEHMDGLDTLLTRFNELLMPGARIFIAVPNIARITYNESHGSLLDMPPNHISRWTRQAFEAFAARAGWTLEDFRVEPQRWRDFVRQDLVYSHMRRAQQSGSLANRIRGRRRTRARVALEGAAALAAAPARLPGWLKAAGQPLGDSVWVQLRAGAAR